MNDISIAEHSSRPGHSGQAGRRFFMIRYKIDTKGYYIRDLGGDTGGTFVRVDRPLVSRQAVKL